tara:strand:+ start:531 stop:1232 length:702 start_codon:yes stop_codon:yes gene_type:complete
MSETDNTQNTEPTQAPVENTPSVDTTESEAKAFTQADLDKIVADRIARERRKFEKKYEGIDPDYYSELANKAEKEKQDKLKAKGEFEQILKQQAEKSQATIDNLLNQVKTIKVDGSLLDAASKHKAVNPGQVATLIKDQVKMNEAGDVEIVDPKSGQVRYKDDGNHFTVSDLVGEFLTANPHFVSATPSGSGSQSKIGDVAGSGEKVDITKLDMSKPGDRQKYAEYRKTAGLR